LLLSELLSASRVKVPLGSRTKAEVLRELVELVAAERGTANIDEILGAVREREDVLSTGIGAGVAIPHGKASCTDELTLAAGVATEGIDFDSLDGRPVQLFFLLVGPEASSGAHVKALSKISRMLRRDELKQRLLDATTPDAFVRVIEESEAA
jgi:mannitol/fructose-specific phosphotransferase system IIA component (Ntr-type)